MALLLLLLLLLLFVISKCLNFMYVYLLNIMLYTLPYACADPGIFVRGGGGGPGQSDKTKL